MLSQKGFDSWADDYDRSVDRCDRAEAYPFAGYTQVLGEIGRAVCRKPHASVLDIGFGTGVLTKKLYDAGCRITGIDFSPRMIEIARAKMPEAELLEWDFSRGLPESLAGRRFDFILSTYAFHHLTDTAKAAMIEALREHLAPGGAVMIGDVAFATRAELDACRETSGDRWDPDEIYLVFDELKQSFPSGVLRFRPISRCAGIVTAGPQAARA